MKKLCDRDYSQWAGTMADLLASGNFTKLNIENLVDEVRDLYKQVRDRLLSSLRLILLHLLKWDYQIHKRPQLPTPEFDSLLQTYKPDALIHCAGRASIALSVSDPAPDFCSNTVLTFKIKDA